MMKFKLKFKFKLRNYPLVYETIVLGLVALVVFIVNVQAAFNKTDDTPLEEETKEESTPVAVPATEEGNYLIIDKIDIKVPIIMDVDGKNKTAYNKALNNGVAHMKNTALPGETGNTFIFGHSSYYSGDYRKIFATLNELEENDEIIIKFDKKEYKYNITDKEVVAANEMSVIDQPDDERILTLMTCWPIGSNEKRLVVVALQQE